MYEIPETSRVYILLDARNNIEMIDGGYTTPEDLDGWILVDEGYGDRYNLCQSHYLDGPTWDPIGIPRYKYIDGEIIERSQSEIEEDREALLRENVPEDSTREDRIEQLERSNAELREIVEQLLKELSR